MTRTPRGPAAPCRAFSVLGTLPCFGWAAPRRRASPRPHTEPRGRLVLAPNATPLLLEEARQRPLAGLFCLAGVPPACDRLRQPGARPALRVRGADHHRQGYEEPVTIPKADRGAVEAARSNAVEQGQLWLIAGAASLCGESVPAGLL